MNLDWSRLATQAAEARAALAAQPPAAPPASDGKREEREELAAWLERDRGDHGIAAYAETQKRLTRIATLLRQSAPALAAQPQPPAPAPVPTFLDAIRLAHGCHDYSGGYVGDGAEAFHAGISTVEGVLRRAAAWPWDHQTSAVFAAGSEPPSHPPADGPAAPEGREPAAVAVEASPTTPPAQAAGEREEEAVPTIDDVWHLCEEHDFRLGVDGTDEEEGAEILRDIILAALVRWGRPAALLRQLSAAQALQPVAVSERPWERPGWCDADGCCWWADDRSPLWWTLVDPTQVNRGWLAPAHALPIPILQPPHGGEEEP